jgi:membrane fusion protein, adhesin transport system
MNEIAHTEKRESLEMVQSKRGRYRISRVVLFLLLLTVLILWLVPWQQTIIGSGEVIVFDPMSRPQTVEAQIPGKILAWKVQEGQNIKKGDLIAIIEDIDSKFLDAEQPERVKRQVGQLKASMTAEGERLSRLNKQIGEVKSSRAQQIKNAKERVSQANNRTKAARLAKSQAEVNLQGFIKVSKASAEQRKLQAQDIVRQNEQALIASKQQLSIAKIQLDRIKSLYAEGLESKRTLELTETELVSAQTRVRANTDAINAAKRLAEIGNLGQDQALLDISRQRDVVNQANETFLATQRDVSIAENDIARIDNDTNATIANLEASAQSAQSSLSKSQSDVEKIGIENANVTARRGQGQILAPSDGRIVRVQKFGLGATVKAGEVLATIVPTSVDRAVEVLVTDNDVSFVQVGRPVRLQFAGYPAVQFAGLPGIGVGTFGGRVAFIDQVDDGKSKFRIVIKEDIQTLASGKKDAPWPVASNLRPGAEAVGWIMLDTVPLGFELWRQFNGFPPRRSSDFDPRLGADKKGQEYSNQKVDKADSADYLSPTIKVKSKK